MNLNPLTNDVTHKIYQVQDGSDPWISRLKVQFKNGYELSIVRGLGTYGSDQGLFEIAVFYDGEFVTRELQDDEDADSVIGYLTESDVRHWAVRIANLPNRGG